MLDHMRIIDVRGRGLTNQELTTIRVPGSDVDYVTYRDTPLRYLEIDYEIRARNKDELRKKIDVVSSFIDTKENVPIVFSDESDRTYFGEYAGVQENIEYHHLGIHRGTIFILRDNYKYSPEKTKALKNETNLKVEGTSESKPIFEFTVKKKATFAMIANEHEEYNLIGKPADVDEQIVDERTNIITERGQTLSQWYEPAGNWSGGFATTGDAIVIGNWGTGAGWHGPALEKEIDPLEDFEIEMYVYTRTEQPDQTFRISTNFYDENMSELGMLRLWDKTTNQIRKVVEARIGPYVGNHVNYLISDRNYNLQGQRVWGGIIRLKREGNMFTVYAARVTQGGRHTAIVEETFVDRNNDFAGKLKFIRFDMVNFGSTGKPNEIRIEHVKVTRLNKVLVDQTPYILDVGDKLVFDGVNDDILINGEPRNDLKNFGGSFFTLKPGNNALIVSPENTFDVVCKYRDTFK